MRTIAALFALVCTLPTAAQAGTLASWNFEEGGVSGYGEANLDVLDTSGFDNHGFIYSKDFRVKYTTDAYEGDWALLLNHPEDKRTYPGQVNFPHSYSLEPARGELTAAIKIDHHHAATIFNKSTFQMLQTEPGSQPPVLYPPSIEWPKGRIVGRTVYALRLLETGHIEALVANDDPDEQGPWVSVVSQNRVPLGEWTEIGMRWDGCTLSVTVAGETAEEPYQATPARGLSYQGIGTDPTFGAVDLDAAISQSGAPFSGKIDAVVFREVDCRNSCM